MIINISRAAGFQECCRKAMYYSRERISPFRVADPLLLGGVHPHYFRGKTDAVVAWQNRVWLFEHKTEARTGDSYFIRFLLDFQPTGYLYGIKASTGLRPAGFILNIIKKPTANFKGDPLSVVGFEREAYVRTDADLERFVRELGSLADDYEEAAAGF